MRKHTLAIEHVEVRCDPWVKSFKAIIMLNIGATRFTQYLSFFLMFSKVRKGKEQMCLLESLLAPRLAIHSIGRYLPTIRHILANLLCISIPLAPLAICWWISNLILLLSSKIITENLVLLEFVCIYSLNTLHSQSTGPLPQLK